MKFTMFGLIHIIFMISPIIFVVVFQLISYKKSTRFKLNLGVVVSIIAIIILILRNTEIFFTNGRKFEAELIPLQICHIANFVLLLAFFFNKKSLFTILFTFFLPTAIVATIFANSLTNYSSILNFRAGAYIFGHSLIIALVVHAMINDFIKVNIKQLLKTLGILVVMYVSIHLINNILMWFKLSPNYFYTIRPESGTPLGIFYKLGTQFKTQYFDINPIYLLTVLILGFIVIFCFYGLLRLYYFNKAKIVEAKTKNIN